MTTDSLNDWSTTPALNTNIAGVDIAVNCPPQDVGSFMRISMSQVAYAVQGSGGPIPLTWHVGHLFTTGDADVAGNLTVTGSINASAFTPSVWQVVQIVTAIGSNPQPLALPTTFRRFRVTLQGVSVTTTNSQMYIQFSSTGGAPFINAGYNTLAIEASSAGTIISSATGAGPYIPFSTACIEPNLDPIDATMEIYPGSVALRATTRSNAVCVNPSNFLITDIISGIVATTPAVMNACSIGAFNLTGNTGDTFSGTIILEGLK